MKDGVPRKYLDKNHVYGQDHPLIGIPCLFEGEKPALPYGSHTHEDTAEWPLQEGDDGIRLAILYFDPDSYSEGHTVHVKAMAGVAPEQLVALNPEDVRYRLVFHRVLSWLADNRYGTSRTRKTEAVTT